MPVETASMALRPSLRLRIDQPDDEGTGLGRAALPVAFVLAAGLFLVVGGGNLELGPIEARLGLSAIEPIGPFGQTLGGWDSSVWVGAVLPSRIWSAVGGMTSDAIVRWPAAIAGILIGLSLCRSTRRTVGLRAAILAALTWFGSIGLIDRSADAGLDLIAGLGTAVALDRLLAKGPGWIAGVAAAWAFLAGGWPPLALIAMASIVLGRRGLGVSWSMAVPVVVAVVGWSAWALATAPAEVWAAALASPLTRGPAWGMAIGAVALGLPWSIFAPLGFSKRLRDAWSPSGRSYATGWGQVALASLVIGTVVPGFATAALVPALAGLAIASAASWDALLDTDLVTGSKRWFHAASLIVVVAWTAIMLTWGGHLAVAVGYYRTIAIVLIALAVATATLAAGSAWLGDRRGTLATIALVTIGIKLAHWGIHIPEWNYRHSQGPWGRAIGQWVPPKRKILTLTTWPADLAFATGHPVRKLAHPRLLPDPPVPGAEPKFLLLHESEFDNWQPGWPRVILMNRFEDEDGGRRVLARTEGTYTWKKSYRDTE